MNLPVKPLNRGSSPGSALKVPDLRGAGLSHTDPESGLGRAPNAESLTGHQQGCCRTRRRAGQAGNSPKPSRPEQQTACPPW